MLLDGAQVCACLVAVGQVAGRRVVTVEGLARSGRLSALQHSAINPSFFATDTTFFAYTVLLVGGAARVLGPVAGTVIFWFLIIAGPGPELSPKQ